jgi:hypothetical protein
MKVQALMVAVVAALTFSAASLSAPKTTYPGGTAVIFVKITDKGLTVFDQGTAPRGLRVQFVAINDGKKPHNFMIFGRKTRVIGPGKRAQLVVNLLFRGNFPYRSTLDNGRAFRGLFTVT